MISIQCYIPITLLPGVGMFILSTNNLIIAVNEEIKSLNLDKEKYQLIIQLKLSQLVRLSWAATGLYGSALLFTFAGILEGIYEIEMYKSGLPFILLLSGAAMMSTSMILLIIQAFKSVSIRQKHLHL